MDQIQQTADNNLQAAIDNINNSSTDSSDTATPSDSNDNQNYTDPLAPPPAPQDFGGDINDANSLPMPPDLTPPTDQPSSGPEPIQPAGFSAPNAPSDGAFNPTNTTFDSANVNDDNFGATETYNPLTTDGQPSQNSEFSIPTPNFDSPDSDNYGPSNNFGADAPYPSDNSQQFNNGDNHQGSTNMNNYQDQNQPANAYNSSESSNNYDQSSHSSDTYNQTPTDNFAQNNHPSNNNDQNRPNDNYDQGNRSSNNYDQSNHPSGDYDRNNHPTSEPSNEPLADRNPRNNPSEPSTPNPSRLSGNDAHKIKEAAMRSIIPLLNSPSDTLDPEEKYDLCQEILETTNDQSVLAPTYDAANSIKDEKKRFDALHEIINMID